MSCPFTKIKNTLSFFNRDNDKDNGLDDTLDTEKGLSTSRCPYQSKQIENPKQENMITNKENETQESSDDDAPRGGCPVMNTKKKEPQNKLFERYFEIRRYGNFDFLFSLRGLLDKNEFEEKTKDIRSYPRHLKYTLFHQQNEKLKQIHEKEFPLVFFAYDDIKEKGHKLYRRKKYREALDTYIYAYGLLRWIEFKDSKRASEFLKVPSLDPILDDDIVCKTTYMDDVNVEEDSYKACVVYLLSSMAYTYMELRHYSEAISCLDEAIEHSQDKLPDMFFRRSQARACNKYSTLDELREALIDIDKAILIKPDEPIYIEHKELINRTIEQIKKSEAEKIKELIAKSMKTLENLNKKNLNLDEILFSRKEEITTQYKVIDEMCKTYEMAIKFFTESKNEKQLELSYKEVEDFMNTYSDFSFYYNFSSSNIEREIYDLLEQHEREALKEIKVLKLIDDFKYKICEEIFANGNFNIQLFTHCLEKVVNEEEKEKEEEKKNNSSLFNMTETNITWISRIKSSNLSLYLSILFILFSVVLLGSHYFAYSGGYFGTFFK